MDKLIEEKLIEWKGKTIYSNEQFEREVKESLVEVFNFGFQEGYSKCWEQFKDMDAYQLGLQKGREEAIDKAWQYVVLAVEQGSASKKDFTNLVYRQLQENLSSNQNK